MNLNNAQGLTQAIHFSILTMLKILNTVNAEADLGLATSLTTITSVYFFLDKNCIYLDSERLNDHINQDTFQRLTPLRLSGRRDSNERRKAIGEASVEQQ